MSTLFASFAAFAVPLFAVAATSVLVDGSATLETGAGDRDDPVGLDRPGYRSFKRRGYFGTRRSSMRQRIKRRRYAGRRFPEAPIDIS